MGMTIPPPIPSLFVQSKYTTELRARFREVIVLFFFFLDFLSNAEIFRTARWKTPILSHYFIINHRNAIASRGWRREKKKNETQSTHVFAYVFLIDSPKLATQSLLCPFLRIENSPFMYCQRRLLKKKAQWTVFLYFVIIPWFSTVNVKSSLITRHENSIRLDVDGGDEGYLTIWNNNKNYYYKWKNYCCSRFRYVWVNRWVYKQQFWNSNVNDENITNRISFLFDLCTYKKNF